MNVRAGVLWNDPMSTVCHPCELRTKEQHTTHFLCTEISFWGALAKLRNATMRFVLPLSIRPSVRTEQLDSQWTDFQEI